MQSIDVKSACEIFRIERDGMAATAAQPIHNCGYTLALYVIHMQLNMF